jgi:hypothetical protein
MATTTRITGAWKLIGVPVCEECDDEGILNRREINSYWQAVDRAIAEMREEGMTRGPMGGEPLEEPCHGGPHDCLVCGVDFRELLSFMPKYVVEITETTYTTGKKSEHTESKEFCSETCAREELEDRWLVFEQMATEVREDKR